MFTTIAIIVLVVLIALAVSMAVHFSKGESLFSMLFMFHFLSIAGDLTVALLKIIGQAILEAIEDANK